MDESTAVEILYKTKLGKGGRIHEQRVKELGKNVDGLNQSEEVSRHFESDSKFRRQSNQV